MLSLGILEDWISPINRGKLIVAMKENKMGH